MSDISGDVSCGGDETVCFGESSDDNNKNITVDIDTNSNNCNARASDSFVDLVRAHHKQDIAIQSGLILLLMHGMHILWMAKHDIEGKSSEVHLAITHTYYIGVIAGCFGGGSIMFKQRKKTIYTIAAGISSGCGYLLIINHWLELNEMLIVGKLLAGISYGLAVITIIIHTSEIAAPEYRDILFAFIGVLLSCDLAVSSLYTSSKYFDRSPHLLTGIITLALNCVAFYYNPLLTKESSHFLLWNQGQYLMEDPSEPFDTFKILQNPNLTINDVNNRFDSIKTNVAEEKCCSRNILAYGNAKPLLLCCGVRGAYAIVFNMVIFALTQNDEPDVPFEFLKWLLIGTIVLVITFKQQYFTNIGTVAFVIFTILHNFGLFNLFNPVARYIFLVIFHILVWLLSIPFNIYSLIYVCDSFPLSKKSFSIVVVLVVENVIHLTYTWLLQLYFYIGRNLNMFLNV